ncbi:NAD(P)H-dependent oxidoreductase [Candidatus Saccharibacteria bacterium]|nr:MAG: NAD(P)H-dependent oxidoreductase [Candidatus Saccharibacteria bacterium]
MKTILVVTGSVRPRSANANVVPEVVNALTKQGVGVNIADLAVLAMPFFDAQVPPSDPSFAPEHESVKQWTKMVVDADGVVLVTPEYNHTMSPVQLNAIDWIGKEWERKPVALVGYGWRSGATQAHATAREALAVNLKARVGDSQANLYFMKELNADGTVADREAFERKVDAALNELLELCDTNKSAL